MGTGREQVAMTPKAKLNLIDAARRLKMPPLMRTLLAAAARDPKSRRLTVRVPRERAGRFVKSKEPALVLDFCGNLRSLRHALSENASSRILRIEGLPVREFIPGKLLAGHGNAVLKRWRESWFWKIWFADGGKSRQPMRLVQ